MPSERAAEIAGGLSAEERRDLLAIASWEAWAQASNIPCVQQKTFVEHKLIETYAYIPAHSHLAQSMFRLTDLGREVAEAIKER